jgi:hypothetical protein
MEEEGRLLRRYVAVVRASAQYGGGMDAWSSMVRMVLLVVRSMVLKAVRRDKAPDHRLDA